jgi:hypothetical protein
LSPLYSATYAGNPQSYLKSDTIDPTRVHSTPLYYFYRRLVLMINVDGNNIANITFTINHIENDDIFIESYDSYFENYSSRYPQGF